MATQLPPSNNRAVLITGLNGYIASNLAHHFLTLGYLIHGTVRSSLKASFILNSPDFKPYVSRIKILIVPDITAEDAFNDAVRGVEAIFHLATPINFWSGEKEDVVRPALKGTVGLLETAHKYAGSQLQTFVYMSSLVTLLDPANESDHHYTSSSWNLTAELVASTLANPFNQDQELPFSTLYPASKILAERAVFDFRESSKPGFCIVSVVPGCVIGPPVLLPERVEDVNGTIKPIWEVLSAENKGMPRKVGSGLFVDVRDLAEICGGLVETRLVVIDDRKEGWDGKRVIVVVGRGQPLIMARTLFKKYLERLKHLEVLLKERGKEDDEGGPTFDTQDAEMALGKPWITYEKSILDTAEALEKYLDEI